MKGSMLMAAALVLAAAGSAAAQQDTTHKPAPARAAAPAAAPAATRSTAPAHTATRSARPAAPKWSADDIKAAQEGLVKAKVYTGTPNGKLDSATRRAIREFQRANKMAVTGQLSDSLLAKLKAQQ